MASRTRAWVAAAAFLGVTGVSAALVLHRMAARRIEVAAQTVLQRLNPPARIESAIVAFREQRDTVHDEQRLLQEIVAQAVRLQGDELHRAVKLLSALVFRGVVSSADWKDAIIFSTTRAGVVSAPLLSRLIVDESLPDAIIEFYPHPVRDAVAEQMSILGRIQRVRAELRRAMEDYLAGGVLDELVLLVRSAVAPEDHHEVVKKAIQCAMGSTSQAKEFASLFITMLVKQRVMSRSQVTEAFYRLARNSGELRLDDPSAVNVLAKFLARAVSDGSVPPQALHNAPAFVTAPNWSDAHIPPPTAQKIVLPPTTPSLELSRSMSVQGPFTPVMQETTISYASSAAAVLGEASLILADMPSASLRSIWGMDVVRPLSDLNLAVDNVIRYVKANDTETAVRKLKEMEAPYYHHEVVKQIMIYAVKSGDSAVCAKGAKFICQLFNLRLVTRSCVIKGVTRFLESADELQKLNSQSAALAASFLVYITDENARCLPHEFAAELPSLTRQRLGPVAASILTTFDDSY